MAKDLKIGALLDVYGVFLSKKQRTLCEHYYYDDLSLSEIAENEGITRQGVRDIIHRGCMELQKFEDECHYAKTFGELKKLCDSADFDKEKVRALLDQL